MHTEIENEAFKPFKIFQASSTACKSYSDVGFIPISHLDPSQMLPAVTLT